MAEYLGKSGYSHLTALIAARHWTPTMHRYFLVWLGGIDSTLTNNHLKIEAGMNLLKKKPGKEDGDCGLKLILSLHGIGEEVRERNSAAHVDQSDIAER